MARNAQLMIVSLWIRSLSILARRRARVMRCALLLCEVNKLQTGNLNVQSKMDEGKAYWLSLKWVESVSINQALFDIRFLTEVRRENRMNSKQNGRMVVTTLHLLHEKAFILCGARNHSMWKRDTHRSKFVRFANLRLFPISRTQLLQAFTISFCNASFSTFLLLQRQIVPVSDSWSGAVRIDHNWTKCGGKVELVDPFRTSIRGWKA